MSAHDPISALTHQLARLPGIGRKSALRLAYFILQESNQYAGRLADAITKARDSLCFCSVCGNLSEADPCRICADTRRDGALVCVVEQVPDLLAIEATGEFKGRYHILKGAISPLNGIGPEQLRIHDLQARVMRDSVREVILATNQTVDGEATALYIQKMLKPSGAKLTRLASGVPVGGDLEYLDRETITRALNGRREL
jgi:recombination protein RecR